MFSFQNKKMLLPGRDARKNPCHTSECGGRNTPFTASVADRMELGKGPPYIFYHGLYDRKYYPPFINGEMIGC